LVLPVSQWKWRLTVRATVQTIHYNLENGTNQEPIRGIVPLEGEKKEIFGYFKRRHRRARL
jgi:hypothetical protein